MNKIVIILCLLLTGLAIGGITLLLKSNPTVPTEANGQSNVVMMEGKQIIEIRAKGGYAPRVTVAKANTPTIINVRTSGTFDCSSALTVPAVGFRAMLPSTGVTPIEVPPQQPGAMIKGVCSMGMYNFAVNFQ